ncbi:MAG: dinitrogenase iron-molybdenum cofactor biosynthesis protein [Dehalococcoidales bacterium]|nr:dinitrogenase iron-molybdenum cofactor biosynthesis protein [Dehalococcoidales bacterium]
MKIAVSASQNKLDSPLDPRFGRCPFFIIVDSDTMECEAVDSAGAGASGGAGTSAGQEMVIRGVEVVLTGNCGPNAVQVLQAAGIKVITGATGTVREAVEKLKKEQ